MILKVVGSGSSGNCYLLENDDECLILEAGVPIKEVKIALDFNISKIVGAVALHVHGDHSKYLNEYRQTGIFVYCPYEDDEELAVKPFKFGNFTSQCFPNRALDGRWLHSNADGSECPCYGVWIHHKDMGTLVYDSDTECIVQRFKDVNHFLIEADYSKDLIVDNHTDSVRNRVYRSHMEIETTCDFLKANVSDSTRTVTLCHLSAVASDSKAFSERVKASVGIEPFIARKGLVVNLRR